MKLVTIFCVIFMMSCSGSTEAKKEYVEIIKEAWTLFQAGNYDQAITTFNDAKTSDDSKADAYLGLAWIQIKKANLNDAHDFLTTAKTKLDVKAHIEAAFAFLKNAQTQT